MFIWSFRTTSTTQAFLTHPTTDAVIQSQGASGQQIVDAIRQAFG